MPVLKGSALSYGVFRGTRLTDTVGEFFLIQTKSYRHDFNTRPIPCHMTKYDVKDVKLLTYSVCKCHVLWLNFCVFFLHEIGFGFRGYPACLTQE